MAPCSFEPGCDTSRRALRWRRIAELPDYAQSAKLFDLLLTVPTFGGVKVHRLLTHARISPSETIGDPSEHQRDELVSLLRR